MACPNAACSSAVDNANNNMNADGNDEASFFDKHFYRVELEDTAMCILKRYQNLTKIGFGAQGFVCSAYDTVDQRKVAIKKLNRPFRDVTQAKRAYREFKLLLSVNHKNVIGLLNAYTPQRTLQKFTDFYIVMELMEGNLCQVVRAQLNHDRISYLVYQMVCGVHYLHSAGISHRDLKPSNLGANSDCTLKILDFGLARCRSAMSFTKSAYVVTRYYRAPEVILGMDYDERVDIWSIGCCFGELIRKMIIFPGVDYADQWTKIVTLLGSPSELFLQRLEPNTRTYLEQQPRQSGQPFEVLFPDDVFPTEPDNSLWAVYQRKLYASKHSMNGNENPVIKTASELARDLLWRMLQIDPDTRITLEDALRHPYVNVWFDKDEVTTAPPAEYDQKIEEQDYSIEHWKELLFAELLDYESKHNVFGESAQTFKPTTV